MTDNPTMRAYVLRRYRADGADFEQIERPQPGPGQVLIRVQAAGLNPVDYKIRDGAMRPLGLHRLPVVMGCELAGTVVDRHADAKRQDIGTRVCLRTPVDTMGGFADYLVADESQVCRVPDAVDTQTAATLPLAGLSAWQALHDVARVQPGERAFVAAGGGGVGSLAIQIAKLAGAHVATTVSPAGHDLVQSLGADEIINYREQDPARVLSGFDVALDLLGGEHTAAAMDTLKPGARLVSLSGPPEPGTEFNGQKAGVLVRGLLAANLARTRWGARRRQVSYRYLFMRADADQLDHLLALAADGRISVPVVSTAPADRLDELMGELEQGHVKGKLAALWATQPRGGGADST